MVKNNILIFGASGLIGNTLYKNFLKEKIYVTGTYKSNKKKNLVKYDIKKDSIKKIKNLKRFSHFILSHGGNTSLDEVEINWRDAKEIYCDQTIQLISNLMKLKKKIIFISSDAVFDGVKGNYKEVSKRNPINYYGKLKYKVENYILKNVENYLIIRVSKVFNFNKNKKHFLSEILKNIKNKNYKFVYDEFFSPIELNELSSFVLNLIKTDQTGIFHLSSISKISRYIIAKKVVKYLKLRKKINKIKISSLNLKSNRGLNLYLNSNKYDNFFNKNKKTITYYISKFLN